MCVCIIMIDGSDLCQSVQNPCKSIYSGTGWHRFIYVKGN